MKIDPRKINKKDNKLPLVVESDMSPQFEGDRKRFRERYARAQEATLRAQARDERPPTGLEDLEVD